MQRGTVSAEPLRQPDHDAGASSGSALTAGGVWNFDSSTLPWPSGVRSMAMSARTSSSPTRSACRTARSAMSAVVDAVAHDSSSVVSGDHFDLDQLSGRPSCVVPDNSTWRRMSPGLIPNGTPRRRQKDISSSAVASACEATVGDVERSRPRT
jgi:hypothetical protein